MVSVWQDESRRLFASIKKTCALYSERRPHSARLFESTDAKLGDESELFRDLEN
jgi:hypothetical protein